jgi:hypothetical protein
VLSSVVAATEDIEVDCPLTATHFSFLESSFGLACLSVASSSDVTLSSVSASTPVLLSASELETEDSVDDEVAEGVGGGTSVAVEDAAATEEDSAFSRKAFLALSRASFLSVF